MPSVAQRSAAVRSAAVRSAALCSLALFAAALLGTSVAAAEPSEGERAAPPGWTDEAAPYASFMAPGAERASVGASGRELPSASEPAVAAPSARPLTVGAPDGARDQGAQGGLRTAAYVSLGIGGLATLIGTGLALSAIQVRDRTDSAPVPCFSGSSCNGTPAIERWRTQASGAALSYTVGLLGLVTGGVLWLAHRESGAAQPALKIADVEIEARVRANGAALLGRF